PVKRLVRLSSIVLPPGGMCLGTLEDTDEKRKSQADTATSDALRRAATAAPGSGVPKTDDPATRTFAPAWARRAAVSYLTPPSTDTRTSRWLGNSRSARIFS